MAGIDSTAVEFGLINTLRTGNFVVDTLICMILPMIIKYMMTFANQPGNTPILTRIKKWILRNHDDEYVYRTIELTQRFNQYGKVWDGSQKNHLLQKAIAIYLAEQLDLSGKNARYELLEKKTKLLQDVTKKLEDEVDIVDDNASDTTCSLSSSSSSSSYDSDSDSDDDDYCHEVNKLNVGPLPPNNAWVDIEKGIEFKHEIVENDDGGQGEVKNVKVSKVVFHFRTKKEVGTAPVDRLIQKAFEKYQDAEKKKYTSDTSRYMYVRTGDSSSSSNQDGEGSSTAPTYKRYALGEEKTFDTLFFDQKDQVLMLLDHFTNRRGKFAIKGFPYKLGLLLHGPPGTGKTSMIKAIAQYTKRNIVTVSLGKIKTNQELLDTMFDLKFQVESLDLPVKMSFKDVVFVMEDIDCATSIVKTRSKTSSKDDDNATSSLLDDASPFLFTKEELEFLGPKKKDGSSGSFGSSGSDKLNLSGLLNALDGVIDCPGRIVIMTTNHPEKLDPALVRPGRVNKKILLSYMSPLQVQKMIEYYFSPSLFSNEQTLRLANMMMHEEAMKKKYTPAEIEELCAEHDSIEEVLEEMEKKILLGEELLTAEAY